VPRETLDWVLRGTYGGSSFLCNIGICLSNYMASLSGCVCPSLKFRNRSEDLRKGRNNEDHHVVAITFV